MVADLIRQETRLERSPWHRTVLPWMVLLSVLIVVALFLTLRGPELPAYRIEPGPLVQTVVATGRVIGTSRAQVGSEVTGTVLERHVREGDVVKPGDLLVVMRSDDLAARVRAAEAALLQLQRVTRPQAAAALRQAEARAAQAARERERRGELFARQLVAREALEQASEEAAVAEAAAETARLAAQAVAPDQSEERGLREQLADARAQLAKTRIRAQVDGVILTRNVEPGDLVQPGRILFEIARSGDTEIEVQVDEKNLAVLAIGQTAQCVADAYPDRTFSATVNHVAPAVDAQRGTLIVRLRVDPVPDHLRQDMTVSVNVETGRRTQTLAVPNDALVDTDTPQPAVLAVRDGRLVRVPVTTGLAGLAMTEITAGIEAGDRVLAAADTVDLEEGSRLRVTLEALPDAATDRASNRELPVRFD